MVEPLLIIVGVIALIALISAVLRPRPDEDAIQKRVLSILEEQAGQELTAEMKSELYVELAKITDIATAAAQLRGLSEKEFMRLYRKGAIQAYTTALALCRYGYGHSTSSV